MKTFWVNALGEFGRQKGKHEEFPLVESELAPQELEVLERHERLSFTLDLTDSQFRFNAGIMDEKPYVQMSIEFMYYIDQYEVEELVARLAGEFGADELDPFWDAPDNFEQGWYFDRTTGEHTRTADPKEIQYRRQVLVGFDVWGWTDEDVIALRDAIRGRVDSIGLTRDWVGIY